MGHFGTGLLSGLVAGLLVSVITLLFGSYWRQTVRPWIEDLAYKGARIDGTWKCHVRMGDQSRLQQVSIEQRAYSAWGTITYPEDTRGRTHTYHFRGTFLNNVLTALAAESGMARADRGALILALQPGYAEIVMLGKGVWLEGSELTILEYRWTHESPSSTPPVKTV